MKNLAVRVLVAIIAIPILVNIVLFGRAFLVGFVSILTVLAFFEFMKMTQTRIRLFPQMILFGWLVFANWSVFYFGEGALLLSLMIGFAITTFSAVFRRDVVLSSTRVVFTMFGLFYVSLFNFFILIRELGFIKYMKRVCGYCSHSR